MTFQDLKVGDTFDERTLPRRACDLPTLIRWRKVSAGRAECIVQVGYGNSRQVGAVNPFGPGRRVFFVNAG